MKRRMLTTRILMAAALMGTLVLTATMTSDAAEAQADVSGPASKEGSGDDAAELAKKLQNPVANLISVPIQNNWDFGIGPEDAMRYLVNVQPVIPFSLNRDWNLITRTILPFIHMESPVPDGDDTGGIGDILQSFFLLAERIRSVAGITTSSLAPHEERSSHPVRAAGRGRTLERRPASFKVPADAGKLSAIRATIDSAAKISK